MIPVFSQEKKLPSSIYSIPIPRSFSLNLPDKQHWYTCREQFALVFTAETKEMLFSIAPECGEAERVAAFVYQTEQILNFEENGHQYSEFAHTNKNYCMWIRPSDFWLQSELRRQFFTILCRGGRQYIPETNNYDQALFSEPFFVNTKDATLRFLFGYTHFNAVPGSADELYGARGWYAYFASKDRLFIKKKLISPKMNYSNPCVAATDLWG